MAAARSGQARRRRHEPVLRRRPGIGRLFGASMGAEASWLLPAALIGLVAGLWLTWRAAAHRPRPRGLVALGRLASGDRCGVQLHGRHRPPVLQRRARPGRRRAGGHLGRATRRAPGRRWWRAWCSPRCSPATGVWSFVLLNRTPEWWPAMRWVVLVGSIVGRAAARGAGAPAGQGHRGRRRRGRDLRPRRIGGVLDLQRRQRAQRPRHHVGPAEGRRLRRLRRTRRARWPGGVRQPAAATAPQLEALLEGTDNRWAAAAIGSMSVSDLELKTGSSLMAIGGFTGGDPSPTLAQFQQYVADGQVRYFLADSGRGGPVRSPHRIGGRHHGVGGEDLHQDRRRRHDRLRPAVQGVNGS